MKFPLLLSGVLLSVGAFLSLKLPSLQMEVTSAQAADKSSSGCRLQEPQRFLQRSAYVKHGQLQEWKHKKAVRFRAEHYGNVEGLDLERYNSELAYDSAKAVGFMGLGIEVHKKIAPAVRCVERRIKKTCTKKDEQYKPAAMNGFRKRNTF